MDGFWRGFGTNATLSCAKYFPRYEKRSSVQARLTISNVFIRRVRWAMAAARISGDARTQRSGAKLASSPHCSAAFTSAKDCEKASASLVS